MYVAVFVAREFREHSFTTDPCCVAYLE